MRRGLSLLLVMLLVLRGLLGDAMAMGMLPETVPTAPVHQHAVMVTQPIAVDHHQDHASTSEHGSAATPACAANDAGVTDCGHGSEHTCSACGICHSALFTSTANTQQLAIANTALHPLGLTPFASAAAALAIKPPIS